MTDNTTNDQRHSMGNETNDHGQAGKQRHKSITSIVWVALVLALLVVLTGLYVYQNTVRQNEMNAYVNALDSGEPAVLQNFIELYADAPQEHIDSAKAKLVELGRVDREWEQALADGSRIAIEQYMARHPESNHIPKAEAMIDSIDWQQATDDNTAEAYLTYIETHADGAYAKEAQRRYGRLDAQKLKAGERQRVMDVLTAFFTSLGANDKGAMANCLANSLDTFINVGNATKADVIGYMHSQHADGDITALSFVPNDDWSIDKRIVSGGTMEYHATFSVEKKTERADPAKTAIETCSVEAKVDAGEKIFSIIIR